MAHTISRGIGGRHDAIVVGSGIGGLACGALLATRGLRVLVLEQHAVVGGFCHSFVRGRRRFRFDAAVHDISGLGARRPVRHLLGALGLEHSLEFLRMDHEYVLPDLRLRVPRMSTTALAVFLGIDYTPDLAPLTFYVPEPAPDAGGSGILLAAPSLVDPSLAPPGHHVLTLTTLVPQARTRHMFDRPRYRKTTAYKAEKASAAAALIAQAERILPGLSRHVVIEDAATALTIARYTSSSEGAIYGIDQGHDQAGDQRPCFKTPIEGLYLAGASTFPGAGIEAVVISGVIAADDICPVSPPALADASRKGDAS